MPWPHCTRTLAPGHAHAAHARPTAKREPAEADPVERITTGRQAAVSAAPPSRSAELPTRVGLLTSRLGRLHAFSRAAWSPRPAMARNSQPRTPGHSGGAVPESHRSSLFAGRKQPLSSGHQSRWQSLPVAVGLSITAAPAMAPSRFAAARSAPGKPCRSRLIVTRRCDGRARLRCTVRLRGIDGSLDATRSRESPLEKSLGLAQAAFTGAPIAPMSPGASLCPSGNQGAAVTCDPSSHGMARQACRGEFVDHNLGVTASQAGRPHR
jgi:hypothetical protein